MQFDPLFHEYRRLPKIDAHECVSESDRYNFVANVFHTTNDQNLKIDLFINLGFDFGDNSRDNRYYRSMIKLLKITDFDFHLTVHCLSDFSLNKNREDKFLHHILYLYTIMIIEVCESVFYFNSCDKIGGFMQMLDAIFRVGDDSLIQKNINLLICIANKLYKNDVENRTITNVFFNNAHLLQKCAEFCPEHSAERQYFEKWLLRMNQ